MRWPWTKADADVETAKQAVRQAVEDRPKVERVARRARDLRQRNGFGEAIQRAMGARP